MQGECKSLKKSDIPADKGYENHPQNKVIGHFILLRKIHNVDIIPPVQGRNPGGEESSSLLKVISGPESEGGYF